MIDAAETQTLHEYLERVRSMKLHAQGMAVREQSGKLRTLTDREKSQLGLETPVNLDFLKGKDFQLGDTRFLLRFK